MGTLGIEFKVGDKIKTLGGEILVFKECIPEDDYCLKFTDTRGINHTTTLSGSFDCLYQDDLLDLDFSTYNYHLKKDDTTEMFGCQAGMDNKQLELFTNNLINVVQELVSVGGSVGAVRNHIQFIETCSRNGLQITLKEIK